MEKNSAVKFSPLGTTGEIGEILPLVKISRYTVVHNNHKSSFAEYHACSVYY